MRNLHLKDNMRRRWIVAIALTWLMPLRGNAETAGEIGAIAGVNAATLDHQDRESRLGFSGGIFGGMQHAFDERWGFGERLELLYTPRGADTASGGVALGQLREHYVDLALALHPELRFGALSAYAVLGGSLDILLSANKHSTGGPTEYITGDVSRVDVAILTGIGVAWRLGGRGAGTLQPGAISLEVRHDIGLLELDPVNDGFKNRTTSVMLGVSFLLGGRAAQPPPDKPESQVAAP
jgi:Outer membrane protein beta-barrel domain